MLLRKCNQIVRYCHTKITAENNLRDGWKSVIGLEIHAQLSTNSKLFSSAPAIFRAPTNSAVALFDAALPGTLPALNKKAVELAVLTALAFGCKVNPISYFDRKHYFYPDLPAGYQITQQRLPIAENGKIDYAIYQPGLQKEPYFKTSYIKQIQLEQDSGKSLHENTENLCFIDFNRAGIALIEIVFQPDIDNELEACALVKEVIRILKRVGSCSCKMEEASFRVDVNVSVHKEGSALGRRTEIKNLGSIHGIWGAIKSEIGRQVNILNDGGTIKSETFSWDADRKLLKSMREKKEDYRFMPEFNLPPLRLLINPYSENLHKTVRKTSSIFDVRYLKEKVPNLPQEDRKLLAKKYALSKEYAFNLVNQEKLLNYFTEIMKENSLRNPTTVYLLLMYQLLSALKSRNIDLEDCAIPSSYLGELSDLVHKRRITRATCDQILNMILSKNNTSTPLELVEKNCLFMISNPKELRKICKRVLEKEQAAVAFYKRKRKKTVFNSLVNKVIEESKYRADTKVLPELMSDLLEEADDENA